MGTRGLVLATLGMVLVASVGALVPAAAQQGTRCTAEFEVTLSPGIGSEPVSGVFHTGGETGTFDCGGRTGTAGVDGRYGTKDPDTCTSGGEGWVVQSFTIQGENIKNTATFEFGGLSGGFVSGTFDGERYSGTFTFTPTEGNCVTEPATKGAVRLDGTLRS